MPTKRYSSIAGAFNEAVWAITPGKLQEIKAFLEAKIRGTEVPDLVVADYKAAAGRRPNGTQVVNRVGIVPVFGTIVQRVGTMEASSGGISTEELGYQIAGLADDKSISSILLVFDSPGGSVSGTPELADRIHALSQKKRIVGIADSTAASAAYWLLAQCSEACVSPSGQIGSIGVLCEHIDFSKSDAHAGVKTTLIASAKYKVEASPYEPLGAEARAEMQSKVDHFHAEFVRAVARGRNVAFGAVNANFGQGRMVTSRDAVSRRMADKVTTLDALVKRMSEESSSPVRSDRARMDAQLRRNNGQLRFDAHRHYAIRHLPEIQQRHFREHKRFDATRANHPTQLQFLRRQKYVVLQLRQSGGRF